MRYVEKLMITHGLPGSGKTSWSETLESNRDVFVLHADDIREKFYSFGGRYTVRDYIVMGMQEWRGQPNVVVDALVLTNDDIFNVVTLFSEYVHGHLEVVVHYWNEDRKTCLKNDGGRREEESTSMILNARYEDVDVEGLNKRLFAYGAKGIEVTDVVRHDVMLKPDWYLFCKSGVDFGRNGKLRSERWSVGGEYGSCYGGKHMTDGEEPCEFTELDNLFDKKCPELKYRDYREIKKRCISTEETTQSEYYGGYTNYMNWVCDLKKMYEILKEFGYNVIPE